MRTLAERARDEAMARAEANASPNWKFCAVSAIEDVVETVGDNGEFTSDDVWDRLEVGYPEAWTHEPRALGPVMTRVQKAGIIEKTDRTVKSKREECHARDIRVWKVIAL